MALSFTTPDSPVSPNDFMQMTSTPPPPSGHLTTMDTLGPISNPFYQNMNTFSPRNLFPLHGLQEELLRVTKENVTLRNEVEALRNTYHSVSNNFQSISAEIQSLVSAVSEVLTTVKTLNATTPASSGTFLAPHPKFVPLTTADKKTYKEHGLQYWEHPDWTNSPIYKQIEADPIGKKTGRKRGEENVQQLYIEDAEGKPVSGARAEIIRRGIHSLFATLLAKKMAPNTWERDAPADVKLWLVLNAVVMFPEVGFCLDSFWKGNQLATSLYPNWTRSRRAELASQNGGPTIVKEESVEGKVEPEGNLKGKRKNDSPDGGSDSPTTNLPKKTKLDDVGTASQPPASPLPSPGPPQTSMGHFLVSASNENPSATESRTAQAPTGPTTLAKDPPSQPEPVPSSSPDMLPTLSVGETIVESTSPCTESQSAVSHSNVTVPALSDPAIVIASNMSTTASLTPAHGIWQPDPMSTTARGLCAIAWARDNETGTAKQFDSYWRLHAKKDTEFRKDWEQKSKEAAANKAKKAPKAQKKSTKQNGSDQSIFWVWQLRPS
ncbi:hypothetical protein AAF712_013159 [Marasmius tenuissimus]|uniref:Uncharacterized protein n=1 Tax=Marasmius tenuissimus TaxID=585030 RepID=A0ABR2ZFB7_9AGAR